MNEIIREDGNPEELNNLYFSINQDSPVRRVDIQIGSGDWTTYLIESDDPTSGLSPVSSITEKLLANRALYAKGHSARPEVPQKGTGNKWRPTVWELVPDWRASIADLLLTALWLILAIEIVIPFALVYYYHHTNSKVSQN